MPARSLLTPSVVSSPDSAVRPGFLNVRDAAAYLGISPHTLYVWRHRRQGPPSFRMGPRGRVMYRRTALDAWIHQQERADSRSNPALNPLGAAPQRRGNPDA
ncbi:helix-turn-helix transcriptional regulator [Streptomyces sp. SAS_281]|uniref:helix-turn-helix transcriptional regulator n=1 Tax=Streptomyces sp. SAS_281 TaxID=3412744 RepID=UPI00403C7E11